MSLRGPRGLEASVLDAGCAEWRHTISAETDFVDQLRAQFLGLALQHGVAFGDLGSLLTWDLDPRLETSSQLSCALWDEGFWGWEFGFDVSEVFVGDEVGRQACTVPGQAHCRASCTALSHAPGSCTKGQRKPVPSSLHCSRHALSLSVCFSQGQTFHANRLRRQFQKMCTAAWPQPSCFKVGSLSSLGRDADVLCRRCQHRRSLSTETPCAHDTFCRQLARLRDQRPAVPPCISGCTRSDAVQIASVLSPSRTHAPTRSQRVQALWPCTAIVPTTRGAGRNTEAGFEVSSLPVQVNVSEHAKAQGQIWDEARDTLSQRVQACSPSTAPVHNDESCAADDLTQEVRPGDTAALDLLPCTAGQVVCPSTDARGSSLPGLVDLRLQLASRVALFPAELDRPEVRGQQVSQFWWFTGFRAGGSVGDTPQQDRFALFTTASHVEVRSMRRGITLDALVAEIYSVVPGLRSLRILLERLHGLPAVQIAATTREAPPLGTATPVDLRGVGGRVCTINLLPGATTNMVSQEILSSCPPARRPQVPFGLFLPDGRAFVAVPYQVAGPDFIRGSGLPEHVDEAAHDSAEEPWEEDQPAFLQTDIACSARAEGNAPAANACSRKDMLRPAVGEVTPAWLCVRLGTRLPF